MKVNNHQWQQHELHADRHDDRRKHVTQTRLHAITLQPRGQRRFEQLVTMRRTSVLFGPFPFAPKQHFTKPAHAARTWRRTRRLARGIPGTYRRARLQQRPRDRDDSQHGQERELKRRIEELLWTLHQRSEEHTSELQSHSFISYAV